MTIAGPIPTLYGDMQPLLDWQAACAETLLKAQSFQLQMLGVCQQPFVAANQELWDQWVARFGGGVPLDG